MIRDLRELNTNRRKFLRDLAAAGGLAAVAGATVAGEAIPKATSAAPAKKPTGYRVTPHVAKYYDKARI